MNAPETTTSTKKMPGTAIASLICGMEKVESKYGREAWFLLSFGIIAFILGYFCLGVIAPLIGVPVWVISTRKLSQIEGDEKLNRVKRLLDAGLICSIISVFNGPMMFFYIQPINFHAFLLPIEPIKVNYLAANAGTSIGSLVSGILLGSVFFIPLLFFRKTRRWKAYFVFLTIFYAFFNMLAYTGQAIDAGIDEQEARKTGLLILPFFMSFTFAFFPKTRRWYFLVPLLVLLGFLAGTQISRLN